MTEGYKHFRSKLTGKAGYYPAHFGETWDDFEEVDPDTDSCVECVVLPSVEPETTPETKTTKIPKESDK